MQRNCTLVVYNPVAGAEQAGEYLSDLLEAISAKGNLSYVFATGKEGDAEAIVREYGGVVEDIVTLGGDGTLSEVTSALLTHKHRPPVGYISAGTANDFASGVGLGDLDVEDAVHYATTGEGQAFDMGRINGRPFLYVAAFGAFASVSYRTSQVKKNVLGKVAYFLEGLRDLAEIEKYSLEMETDHGSESGDFILGMISNSNRVAGFIDFTSQTDYADGEFEVMLVRAGFSALDYAALARDLASGRTTHPACFTFQTSRLVIRSSRELQWTIDGEEGERGRESTIQVEPQAIRVRTALGTE